MGNTCRFFLTPWIPELQKRAIYFCYILDNCKNTIHANPWKTIRSYLQHFCATPGHYTSVSMLCTILWSEYKYVQLQNQIKYNGHSLWKSLKIQRHSSSRTFRMAALFFYRGAKIRTVFLSQFHPLLVLLMAPEYSLEFIVDWLTRFSMCCSPIRS